MELAYPILHPSCFYNGSDIDMRMEHTLFLTLLLGVLFLAIIPIALRIPVPVIVIESNSMAPHLVRGDIAFVVPAALFDPKAGSVAVFRDTEEISDRWIVHRIIEGDAQAGFTTKGDNNSAIDQAAPDSSRVMPADIAGLAITVWGRPLRIPAIGLLVLGIQQYIDARILSWIALTLGIVCVAADMFGGNRTGPEAAGSRFRSWLLWMPLFGIVVLTLSQTMISNSTEATITYDPIQTSSSELASRQQLDYAVTNQGIFPLILVLYSDDDRVLFSKPHSWLRPGESQTVKISIAERDLKQPAQQSAEAVFRAGTYLPLLPPQVLHKLIAWDIKGTAVATAMVPTVLLSIAFIWIVPAPGNRRTKILWRQRAAQ